LGFRKLSKTKGVEVLKKMNGEVEIGFYIVEHEERH
jgi:hypothetical protein